MTSHIGQLLDIDSMKTVLPLILTCVFSNSAYAGDKVVLIGHYSNIVVTHDRDPHFLSGYELDLYKSNDRTFGSIGIAVGSPEPVDADLNEVSFDEATKHLSFTVKYSSGWEYSDKTGPAGRKSQDVLKFTGVVMPTKIVGQVFIGDGYCPDCKPHIHKVTLRRTADSSVPTSAK